MCDCITQVNEKLKPYDTEVNVTISIQPTPSVRVKLSTFIPLWAKRKHGQKPMNLIASYCPFCGQKYE